MLKVFITICASILLFSCSASDMQSGSLDRAASKSYFKFCVTDNAPTGTAVYYVWSENRTWGSYSVFRVIEPIVDIGSYDEHVISGTGPDGWGNWRMRVLRDETDIESYTSTFFLVKGL